MVQFPLHSAGTMVKEICVLSAVEVVTEPDSPGPVTVTVEVLTPSPCCWVGRKLTAATTKVNASKEDTPVIAVILRLSLKAMA